MDCPYCKTPNAPGAVKCAACTSWMTSAPPVREWTRTRQDRLIAGVCRGLSNRFGIPVAALRLAFLLALVFMMGVGLVVYVALWIAMPLPPEPWLAARAPAAPPPATTVPPPTPPGAGSAS